jgi:hypothetical protein
MKVFYALLGMMKNLPTCRFVTEEQANEILARNPHAVLKEKPDGGTYFGLVEVYDGLPFDRLRFERAYSGTPELQALFSAAVEAIERGTR